MDLDIDDEQPPAKRAGGIVRELPESPDDVISLRRLGGDMFEATLRSGERRNGDAILLTTLPHGQAKVATLQVKEFVVARAKAKAKANAKALQESPTSTAATSQGHFDGCPRHRECMEHCRQCKEVYDNKREAAVQRSNAEEEPFRSEATGLATGPSSGGGSGVSADPLATPMDLDTEDEQGGSDSGVMVVAQC